MPPKKSSASQLEGGPKAPVGPLRRQLSLRAFRDKIPTKEAAVAESRRIMNEGASVFGKRLNDARVVFGSLSQTFKRTTKRRKPLVESPATPAKGRRSDVDLYSPFGIESPAKRQPGRSTYVTPRRRYHDNAASSERRATLRSAAAYRNGGLDVSDVVTPAEKKTPGLSSSSKRRSARVAAVTPGLSADVESINEGMRRLRAVAHRMSGENEATPMR